MSPCSCRCAKRSSRVERFPPAPPRNLPPNRPRAPHVSQPLHRLTASRQRVPEPPRRQSPASHLPQAAPQSPSPTPPPSTSSPPPIVSSPCPLWILCVLCVNSFFSLSLTKTRKAAT